MGASVGHEIRVPHDVYEVLKVSLGEVGEPLVPAPQHKDVEPLEKQAEKRDEAVDPGNNPDQDPVHNPYQQFEPACVMLKRKKLFPCIVNHARMFPC